MKMNEFLRQKCKDKPPDVTIKDIKGILKKLKIQVKEECTEILPGCFSSRISLKNTIFGTNGKGVTKAFALASSYAEFIERIQNQVLFKQVVDVLDYFDESCGFVFSPDEKLVNINEFKKTSSFFYQHLMSLGFSFEEVDRIIVQPFLSVKYKKIEFLPPQILDYLYGSNGMCAGNSIYEALTQGLSEIIERFVMFKVLSGEVTLPEIPVSQVRKIDDVKTICDSINKIENLKIIFKDASHIFNIPSFCAILIDKNAHSYFVRWGVHPIREIAIERSLTEILQKDSLITLYRLMQRFSHFCGDCSTPSNRRNAFTTGAAIYPNSLFSQNNSKSFKENYISNEKTNFEMLKNIVDSIIKQGYDIFIRDVSFLGFPSFRVIVPGLSEVSMTKGGKTDFHERRSISSLKKLLSEGKLDNDRTNDALKKFERIAIDYTQNTRDYLRLPLDTSSKLYNIRIGMVIAMLYFKNAKYTEAYAILNEMIRQAESSLILSVSSFDYCIRDLIGYINDGMSLNRARISMSLFYEDELLENAIHLLAAPDIFFENSFRFTCWECKKCEEKCYCNYYRVKRLVSYIKKIYSKNCPSEKDLIVKLKHIP